MSDLWGEAMGLVQLQIVSPCENKSSGRYAAAKGMICSVPILVAKTPRYAGNTTSNSQKSKSTSHTTSVKLKVEMETYFLVVARVGTLHAVGAGDRVQPRRRGLTTEDGSHCRLAAPGDGRGVANCAKLGAGYRAPPPTRRASIRRPPARPETPASVATTAVLGAAGGHPPSSR